MAGLRENLYKINVTITAFIDVVDINDMSARAVATDRLKELINSGDGFDYDVIETELYDVDELPQ